MEFRTAGPEDIPVLAEMRKRQILDERIRATSNIDAELTRWFGDKLGDGSLVEWVAVEDGAVIATAGIYFMEFPPSWTNPSGRKGYVTSMYTAPAWRGRGLATQLLERLKDEARARGIDRLWLGASPMGRPFFIRQGFRDTDEWMELDL